MDVLTDNLGKINAVNATVFYNGKVDDIDQFVEALKIFHKYFRLEKNRMNGDLTIYQWFSTDKIIQLIRDNKEGIEEQTINGKTTKLKSNYVKLNIFDRSFIENLTQKTAERDTYFASYDDRYFIKTKK